MSLPKSFADWTQQESDVLQHAFLKLTSMGTEEIIGKNLDELLRHKSSNETRMLRRSATFGKVLSTIRRFTSRAKCFGEGWNTFSAEYWWRIAVGSSRTEYVLNTRHHGAQPQGRGIAAQPGLPGGVGEPKPHRKLVLEDGSAGIRFLVGRAL